MALRKFLVDKSFLVDNMMLIMKPEKWSICDTIKMYSYGSLPYVD